MYVLKQAKAVFFSLYTFFGRTHHFFGKSTLYINGFSNSDRFDLICLDYAYKLVEAVVAQGKYEDNMHLFDSSSVVCYVGNKRLFMRTNFVKTNKLRLAQPFQYPRNSWYLKVHQCRSKNLLISLSSHKNNTSKVLHYNSILI